MGQRIWSRQCRGLYSEQGRILLQDRLRLRKPGHGPWLEIDSRAVKLSRPDSVQLVVGDDAFHLTVTPQKYSRSLYAELDDRGSRVELSKFVAAITSTKLDSFSVEYPGINKEETFSLKGAAKALSDGGKTIMDACL